MRLPPVSERVWVSAVFILGFAVFLAYLHFFVTSKP